MLCRAAAAAPSLSCASKGTARSTACISYGVFLESSAPLWFSLQEHSQEELQEPLSPSPELCPTDLVKINSLNTYLKWWRNFLLFYGVFWVQWAQGWGWFEQKPLSTTNIFPSFSFAISSSALLVPPGSGSSKFFRIKNWPCWFIYRLVQPGFKVGEGTEKAEFALHQLEYLFLCSDKQLSYNQNSRYGFNIIVRI